jgi:sec-independent protein translocase protein TatB
MFDIGFSEILLILGLALVVLGPTKLPQVARTIGRWAGRARAMAHQFREQLEQEADEIKLNLDTSGVPPAAKSTPAPQSAPAPAPTPAPEATSAHTAPPPALDEFAAHDAATTPAAMHAADPPPAASNDRPT